MKKYEVLITYTHMDIVEAEDENEAMEKADDILNNIFDDFRKKYFDIEVEEIPEDLEIPNHITNVNKIVEEEIK